MPLFVLTSRLRCHHYIDIVGSVEDRCQEFSSSSFSSTFICISMTAAAKSTKFLSYVFLQRTFFPDVFRTHSSRSRHFFHAKLSSLPSSPLKVYQTFSHLSFDFPTSSTITAELVGVDFVVVVFQSVHLNFSFAFT